ncbi:Putative SMAD/FHA domain-containing protein [Rhizopus microsporus]|nr:Putative SMAD/FHA domain-containing protein [Rhizopus microsporus]
MPSPSRSYQRSRSPRRTRSRSPNRSCSPRDRRRRHSPPSPRRRHRPDQKDAPRQRRHEWGGRGASADRKEEEEEPAEREGPNFGLSGKLAAETNTVKGVELKYNEPPEAAKPDKKWRLYVFKKDEQIDLLHIHRQSSYLIGRDRVTYQWIILLALNNTPLFNIEK